MFFKGNKSAARRPTPSIVGADCVFTGDIASDGEVQIDGCLQGDLRCQTLIIGEQGSVMGEIKAETVSVLGSVTGQITAQAVALAKSARILGDIVHGSLSVEVGAFVEGRFHRLPNEPLVEEAKGDPADAAASTRTPAGTSVEVAAPAPVALLGR